VYLNASSYGGQVSILGPISTGKIDVSGGNGGNSGAVGTSWTIGGSGGNGGYVNYDGSTINVKGPIFARGGNGGNMINSSILAAAGTPDGGSGGFGGSVNVFGSGEVQINVGGTLGAVAIDVSGGMGGSGHPAASPAGNGGAGGGGGSVDVVGTPDMTLFGSVIATGGAGGAGGAGNATNVGGAGGAGGNAGFIFLDASSSASSQTGDGIIFVLAGTQFNVQGGSGGAGGVDGGAGAGAGGIAGSTIGGGRGSVAGAVAGAILGGIAGSAIEKDATKANGVELTLRLDSGRIVAIVQEGSGAEFRPGDRVRVTSDGHTTRVTR